MIHLWILKKSTSTRYTMRLKRMDRGFCVLSKGPLLLKGWTNISGMMTLLQLQLCYGRARESANFFTRALGVHLHGSGVRRRVISTLQGLGKPTERSSRPAKIFHKGKDIIQRWKCLCWLYYADSIPRRTREYLCCPWQFWLSRTSSPPDNW